MRIVLLPPLCCLLLAGCLSGGDDFPSLAKRPYEIDQTQQAEPVEDDIAFERGELTDPLSLEQRRMLDDALDQHAKARTRFIANRAEVERQVAAARGAAPGSESWVVAQLALSRLDTDRSPSVGALSEIDGLLTERLLQEQQGGPPGGAEQIRQAQGIVAAAVAQQSALLASLAARLQP